jgi:PTH1 family peptidyl-tRNA hydrolase
MRLVAGLGNPGVEYAATRHNVGFAVADLLARRHGVLTWNRKFRGELATTDIGGKRVILLKPQTYMNRSGDSVQAACAFYRIPPTEIIVTHDDIDFALGRIAVKTGGGHGGHKGLQSITSHLGPEFVRLRLGVGRPEHGDVSNYVLGPFRGADIKIVDEMLERAADAVEVILGDSVKAAQNRFNKKPALVAEDPAPES